MPSLNGETKIENQAQRREGDVFKTSLNGCTFTVTQRNKWSPLKRRAVFYQRTGQRNQQFCDSSFEGFLLFVLECWGVCGALAAEAIWVSSTSKVGQLVPVPLLMCWRGALCRGLRAWLKGLRSLLGEGGAGCGQQRWGSGPQGHVKAVPCPLTSESQSRPGHCTHSKHTSTVSSLQPLNDQTDTIGGWIHSKSEPLD